MRLAGRAAVITGASAGIGRASAIRFAAEGARLVLADTHESDGHALVEELQARGSAACFIRTDVGQRHDNHSSGQRFAGQFYRVVLLFSARDNQPRHRRPADRRDDLRLVQRQELIQAVEDWHDAIVVE